MCIRDSIKEDCAAGAALIAQRCPDLRSRFIIQIYHPEEYDQVADLGFEHIILTCLLYTSRCV